MRGRKKKEESKRKVISIRVTEQQHEIIKKNNWIKKELDDLVRDYLKIYLEE